LLFVVVFKNTININILGAVVVVL